METVVSSILWDRVTVEKGATVEGAIVGDGCRIAGGALLAKPDVARSLRPDLTIVNMHYAPTTTTLGHEPMAKHWMLGNSILGRVVDIGR